MPARARLRGVSLIEMMIVVALVSIIGAIAAPSLLPITKKARLASEAEAVASFLNTVRERAIAKNRCHRVLITATQMTTEERNSADCASQTVNFTRIADGSVVDGWLPAAGQLRADKGTTYSFTAADCATCGAVANNLVFRPSGRLRGDNDLQTLDDRVRVRVLQSGLTEQKNVVVMGSGRICVVHVGGAPGAIATATPQTDCSLAIP